MTKLLNQMTAEEWDAAWKPEEMLPLCFGRISNRKHRLIAIGIERLTEAKYQRRPSDAEFALAEAFANGIRTETSSDHYMLHKSEPYAASESVRVRSLEKPMCAGVIREVAGNPWRPTPERDVICPGCDGAGGWGSTSGRRGGPGGQTVTACRRCGGEGKVFSWLTDDVLSLATAAYEKRGRVETCRSCSGEGCSGNVGYLDDPKKRCDGSGRRKVMDGTLDPLRLSILADALEEANADAAIIEHLRLTTPHVRGCWALDLVLGKE